jgi:hypothetical protein
MNLMEEMATYLDTEGLVDYNTPNGGNVFIPSYVGVDSAPDIAILIRPTGGGRADGKREYDDPTIQIIVRSTTDPTPGMTKAQAIYDKLHGFHVSTFTTGGRKIINCVGIQSQPAYIGMDANGRHEYSLNFQLHVQNTNRRA